MKEGTVKFFNESKGFGFIKETATGQEYFVHIKPSKMLGFFVSLHVAFLFFVE
jgi:cold shock CspA family protein